jgi:hypothetical protein
MSDLPIKETLHFLLRTVRCNAYYIGPVTIINEAVQVLPCSTKMEQVDATEPAGQKERLSEQVGKAIHR